MFNTIIKSILNFYTNIDITSKALIIYTILKSWFNIFLTTITNLFDSFIFILKSFTIIKFYLDNKGKILDSFCIATIFLILFKLTFALTFNFYPKFYYNILIIIICFIIAYNYNYMKKLKYYLVIIFGKLLPVTLVAFDDLGYLYTRYNKWADFSVFVKPWYNILLDKILIFLIYIRLFMFNEPYLFFILRFILFTLLIMNKWFILIAILSIINVGGRIMYYFLLETETKMQQALFRMLQDQCDAEDINYQLIDENGDTINEPKQACVYFQGELEVLYQYKQIIILPTWNNAILVYIFNLHTIADYTDRDYLDRNSLYDSEVYYKLERNNEALSNWKWFTEYKLKDSFTTIFYGELFYKNQVINYFSPLSSDGAFSDSYSFEFAPYCKFKITDSRNTIFFYSLFSILLILLLYYLNINTINDIAEFVTPFVFTPLIAPTVSRIYFNTFKKNITIVGEFKEKDIINNKNFNNALTYHPCTMFFNPVINSYTVFLKTTSNVNTKTSHLTIPQYYNTIRQDLIGSRAIGYQYLAKDPEFNFWQNHYNNSSLDIKGFEKEERASLIVYGIQNAYIWKIIKTMPEYVLFLNEQKKFNHSPNGNSLEIVDHAIACLEDTSTNKLGLKYYLEEVINTVIKLKGLSAAQYNTLNRQNKLIQNYPATLIHSQLTLFSPNYNSTNTIIESLNSFLPLVKSMIHIAELNQYIPENQFYVENLNKLYISTPATITGERIPFLLGKEPTILALTHGEKLNIKNRTTGRNVELLIEGKHENGMPKGSYSEIPRRNRIKYNPQEYKNIKTGQEIVIWTGNKNKKFGNGIDET